MPKNVELHQKIRELEDQLNSLDDQRHSLIDELVKHRNQLNFLTALNNAETLKFIKDAVKEYEST